jgi:hypothetical protein
LAALAALAVVEMVEVKQIHQPLKTEPLIQVAVVAAVGSTPQDMLLVLAALALSFSNTPSPYNLS